MAMKHRKPYSAVVAVYVLVAPNSPLAHPLCAPQHAIDLFTQVEVVNTSKGGKYSKFKVRMEVRGGELRSPAIRYVFAGMYMCRM